MEEDKIGSQLGGKEISLSGMYKEYFLDYASYVILERAVPAIEDGMKPVQRRILHSMHVMDDGRYHKVANIIGQTMQYHPHGDAAIGDALVKMGQKDLLIDTQGNWGDYRTGDSAAASRYIEARLTKFALEVLFNPQTTQWQMSYDGRKNEPITLPAKFPLLLAQGADGIAVGLSTKILPHNFIELIEASIDLLKGKEVVIFPDFQTGGKIDISDYQLGERGGKIRVRARIEQESKSVLLVKDLPYGVTTGNLIDSILKANEKGKIKIKKVVDNTAEDVEVAIELAPGISPEVAADALYAFTDCEVSISPNCCIIVDNKPVFTHVVEVLKYNTDHTKNLLKLELEIRKAELLEKWHFASLEKIFIENRVYRSIEECESWEEVLQIVDAEMRKYIATPSTPPQEVADRLLLNREFTHEDIHKLTEIKIKRISKYNSFKAEESLSKLEEEIEEVNHHLEHLVQFTIQYYKNLKEKFGKGRERKTQIEQFDLIERQQVVYNNAKLYVNRKEGFVGMDLKKDEFVCDCSDIDDVIVFLSDGTFQVSRIAEKSFVGKNILHVDVWRKGDERTTYNLIYLDGSTGKAMAKRFNVTAITRDRLYDLTGGEKGSKLLYFAAHPNGEAEIVSIQLTQSSKARIKIFDFDFSGIDIKGRASKGNIVTKHPIRKIEMKTLGKSTLGAQKVWLDCITGKLNLEERGTYLGEFDTGDSILFLYKEGSYEIYPVDFNEMQHKFNCNELLEFAKYTANTVVSAIYYDAQKEWTLVKRFKIETSSTHQRFSFIADQDGSKLLFATLKTKAVVRYDYKLDRKKIEGELNLDQFIEVKGWKAMGNKLSDQLLSGLELISFEEPEPAGQMAREHVGEQGSQASIFGEERSNSPSASPDSLKIQPGDTLEFDL
jgi:topoisomerase IV subunit A